MEKGEGSSSSSPADTRVIQEYDFFNEKRSGPRGSHIVPRVPMPVYKTSHSIAEDAVTGCLFNRTLKFWDVRQNGLVITPGMMMMGNLNQEERRQLVREGFLEVPTLDPHQNCYNMRLRHTQLSNSAAMCGRWLKLVRANSLKEGDKITGWAFRSRNGTLCCAITLKRRLI